MTVTEQYVRCGVLGHAWFEYENSSWRPEFGVPLVLRCERCNTERHDSLDPADGTLRARSYDYPPGYKYARGERPTMTEFRKALIDLRAKERKRTKRAANVVEMRKR